MHTKFSSADPKGKEHSEDPGVDGNIILEWNRVGRCELDSFG
jgi:hypothetical protein